MASNCIPLSKTAVIGGEPAYDKLAVEVRRLITQPGICLIVTDYPSRHRGASTFAHIYLTPPELDQFISALQAVRTSLGEE